MISKEQREKDKAICEAATPGPWTMTSIPHDERPETQEVCDLVNDLWVIAGQHRLSRPEEDGAFIARAREALPAYIADAEEMELRVAKLAEAAAAATRRSARQPIGGGASDCVAAAYQHALGILLGKL